MKKSNLSAIRSLYINQFLHMSRKERRKFFPKIEFAWNSTVILIFVFYLCVLKMVNLPFVMKSRP